MDIVVTGYAGLSGSLAIYKDEKLGRSLKERYSESFFSVFENISASGDCIIKDREKTAEGTADKQAEESLSGTAEVRQIDELYEDLEQQGLAADGGCGGVLAALWKVLKDNRSGGMYALKSIPLLQQTVEVCEMFSLNPYRLYAPGCKVWLSADTGALAAAAAAAGVPLSVIGFTSKGTAIKRTDTEADSSLRRPEGDELDRILPMSI